MNPNALLAPYAAKSEISQGRQYSEPPPGNRGEYQRDRDRIIHCTAFRRLVYKTQVFINHEGDLYRTRMTHSLEVAQIARSVARSLSLNEHLVEAVGLAHDLGHTPFGHSGQDALDECMKDYGGFEHNFQSLRVVDELEEKYAEFPGLNLTFETREGILKHCSKKNARRLGELGQRFLDRKRPGLEAQLANIADEIAYNNHDVDDGLRAGLISVDELREVELFSAQYETVHRMYPDLAERRLIHEVVRRMINVVVTDLTRHSQEQIDAVSPDNIDAVRDAPVLIGMSADIHGQHIALKQFLRERLYSHDHVRSVMQQAHQRIVSLFDAYFHDPARMPDQHREIAVQMEIRHAEAGRARAVADYIAGMTDRYAIAACEGIIAWGQ